MNIANYVFGTFVNSYGEEFTVTNPYTQKPFAKVKFVLDSRVEELLKIASKIKKEAAKTPKNLIYNDLIHISKEIKNNRYDLAITIVRETAKPLKYALAEVDRATQTFEFAAKEALRLSPEIISIGTDDNPREAELHKIPVGLVVGISPFNFPLNLVAHKIAPAIASGCPIILKPSPRTPVTAFKLAEIIHTTEVVKKFVSIVNLTLPQTSKMIEDERVAKVTFTGSDKVGWEIKSKLSKKRVTLELGGNAATLVAPSAQLPETVKKCLISSFAFSGQVCIHSQRFYVHHSIFNKFTQAMKSGAENLTIGDPELESTDFSVLIDQEAANRIDLWVNEAIREGAKLITGGNKNQNFYEPTILTQVSPSSKVLTEEIFGPVITIEKYSNFEKALKKINSSRFGLQNSIFSNDESEIQKFFEEIESGSILVNLPTTFRTDDMPYGGVKNSGTGKEGVKYAIEEMTELKLLVR